MAQKKTACFLIFCVALVSAVFATQQVFAAVPEAIDDLVVSGIGYDQITLGWGTPNDGGSAITEYEIQQDSGTWDDISGSGATTVSHTVTGLTPGTSYTFKVRAVNTDGNAPESNTVTVIPNKFTDTIPDGLTLANNDYFGAGAALSSDGTTLAVGAYGDDTGGGDKGAVHLFTKTGTTWARSVTIDNNFTGLNLTHSDNFGVSTALSGDGTQLAVGAYRDDTGGPNNGAVYLFTKSEDTWTYSVKIDNNFTGLTVPIHDNFGSSVALSSDGATLAVGGPRGGNEAGAVYLFTKNNDVWTHSVKIDSNFAGVNLNTNDNFGSSATLSSDGATLAVGVPGKDLPNKNNAGAVYLFTKNGNTWTYSVTIDNNLAGLTLNYNNRFGTSATLSSNGATLAVGAPHDDTSGITNNGRGAVHLFTKNGTQWAYHSKITHGSNGLTLANNDRFGSSAALSSDGTLAVGAQGDNSNKGAAYLFNLHDTVAPYITTQTFTSSTPANGNHSKTGDNLTFSFTFSETLQTAPTISIEGASATFTKSDNTYTATYQVTVATAEGPITYDIDTLTDSAGQSFNPPETNSPFTVDRIAPVITLIGDSPLILEVGDTYTDPGATADTGETVTASPTTVDVTTAGDYTITYTATDAAGNTGTKERVVSVIIDTVEPFLLPLLLPIPSPTGTVLDMTVTPSASGDTIFTLFDAPKQGTLDTVRVGTDKGTYVEFSGDPAKILGKIQMQSGTNNTISFWRPYGVTGAEGLDDVMDDLNTQNKSIYFVTDDGTYELDPGDSNNGGTGFAHFQGINVNGSPVLNAIRAQRTQFRLLVADESQTVHGGVTPSTTTTIITSDNSNSAYAKEGDTLTLTFEVSEDLQSIPAVTIAGQTASVESTENTYTATYTVTADTPEGAATHNIGTLIDTAGNTTDPPLVTSSITIDTTAPTLAAIADGTSGGDSHIGTTTDTTPGFSFTSDEAGTIAYAGSCASSETIAVSGTNTVSFNALTIATYTDCAVTVTDEAGNISSSLAVPDFTVQQEPEAIDDLVVSGIGYDQITLRWTTPDNGGSVITEYEIQQDSGTWDDISGSDASTVDHTVTGLTPGTSYTFKVRAVNGNGAAPDSNTVTVIPNKFVDNIPDELNLANSDQFGISAALSSDGATLAVGAWGDDTGGDNRGAVHLFTKNGDTWTYSTKIADGTNELNLTNNDYFGISTALSSDGATLAVGAHGDNTGGTDKGAVHLFTKSGDIWTHSVKIDSDFTGFTLANSDYFGYSAALSSDGVTLAVGAQGDDTGEDEAGAVHLFTKSGDTWTYSVTIDNDFAGLTLANYNYFGSSAALSSDGATLAVGAWGDGEGAVHLFTKNSTTWAYHSKIAHGSNGLTLAYDDNLGVSTALSEDGTLLAVGASNDDTGGANTNRGAVHLFTKNGTQWTHHSKIAHSSNGLTLANSDSFGISAALSSDGTLAVGAQGDNTGGTGESNRGAAYLFNLPDTIAPYIAAQTFTNGTPENGNHPKAGDNLNFSFTFSETLSTAPTITIGGAPATFTNNNNTYTATYTVPATTTEGPITYNIGTLTDSDSQSFNPPETNSPFTIDTTAPTLAAIADGTSGGDSHIGTTTDTTPDFSFTSDEAGTIAYAGGCASSETIAVSGTNTVSFNALTPATYTDCAVTVTDGAGNISSSLAVPDFTVQQEPEAIDDLVVSGIGYDQITLRWTTPDNGGSVITRYEIQQNSNTWTAIAGSDASTTDHTVTGLTPGTSDTFKVRAVNGNGDAPDSNTVTVIPNKFADTIPDGLTLANSDYFGSSAAFSSDGATLAVGAHGDNASGAGRGAVHLFTKTGSTWTHSMKIDSSFTGLNLANSDHFGISVALSSDGTTLAVGAHGDNTNGDDRGAVHLFTKSGDTWIYSTKIADGTDGFTLNNGDQFGTSTALSSDGATLAVGVVGAVHLFTKTSTTWTHSVKIDNDFAGLTLASNDQFGSSAALSSDGATLAVGAWVDDTGGSNKGAVHLFTKDGTQWTYHSKIADGTNGFTLAVNDYFGTSTALSEDGMLLAVGAQRDDTGGTDTDTDRGAVHLFTKNGTQWAYHSKIADGSHGLTLGNDDYFGSSAALSSDGTTLAVGARYDDTGGVNNNRGAAYLFNLPDTIAPYIATQTFTNSTPANGNHPKTGDSLTFSFTFSETLPTAPTISIEGGTAVPLTNSSGSTYTATYQVIAATAEGPITYDINTLTDSAGQSFNPPETNSPFTVDRIAPTLAAIADDPSGIDSHIGTTTDTTPDFSFTSDEAGTIDYTGSCTSLETTAVSGTNTVSFSTLAYAAYTDCAVTVTDEAGNISSSLTVPNFITVQVLQIPDAIDDLVVSGIGYDQITLGWTTPDNEGSAITGYEIQQNSGTWAAIAGSDATTVTGLTPGTSYTFKVRAVNSDGDAPDSNIVTVIPNKFVSGTPDGLTLAVNDYFGYSAALSSDGATLAVGAWGDDANKGAVHLFTKTGTTWTHSVTIDSNFTGLNLVNNDYFGISAALSADGATLAVGAQSDNTGGNNRGAVHLFTKSGDTWMYSAKIAHGTDGLTLADNDNFGSAAALSADGATLAVGAKSDDTDGTNKGAVHLFTKSGDTWMYSAKIAHGTDGLSLTNHDEFGSAAALSSDGATLAVGAHKDDTGGANADRGAVHLFTKSNGVWTYSTKIAHGTDGLTLTNDDFFGTAAVFSSNGATLAVGARGDDTGGANTNKGAVHLFTKNGTQWTYHSKIADGSHGLTLANNDYFGSSTALSADGATLAVGAQSDNTGGDNKGAAYLFNLHDTIAPYIITQTFTNDNQTNDRYPKTGDNLTFSFTFSETLPTAPTITIEGASATFTKTGDTYTATYQVTVATAEGPITYDINTLTDSAGQSFDPPETNSPFTVDRIAPVITLTGDSPLILEVGDTYTDTGATADTGETVTASPTTVDVTTAGDYTITYTATDAAGNIGTKERVVSVIIDTVEPLLVTPLPTGTVLDITVTPSASGDVIVALYQGNNDPPIQGTLDTVRVGTDKGTYVEFSEDPAKILGRVEIHNARISLWRPYHIDGTEGLNIMLDDLDTQNKSIYFVTNDGTYELDPENVSNAGTGYAHFNSINVNGSPVLNAIRAQRAQFRLLVADESQTVHGGATPSTTIITSDNSNSAYAKEGDTLTLIFEVSEDLQSIPAVTIAGQTASVESTENTYTATYTVTADTPEGAATHNIGTLTDTAGNTTDPPLVTSSITLDTTAPVITVGTITPTGAAQSKTVSMTVADTNKKSDGYRYAITAGSTCDNTVIADNNAETAYTEGTDVLLDQTNYNTQYVCFRAEDEAGNTNYRVSGQITGISPVSVESITFTSDNSNPAYAKAGDTITVTLVTDRELSTDPAVTVQGNTVTLTHTTGTTYTGTYQVTDATDEGPIAYNIGTLTDTTGTSDPPAGTDNSVTIDTADPLLPIPLPTGTVLDMTVTPSASGDTIFTLFDTPKQGTLDTVRVGTDRSTYVEFSGDSANILGKIQMRSGTSAQISFWIPYLISPIGANTIMDNLNTQNKSIYFVTNDGTYELDPGDSNSGGTGYAHFSGINVNGTAVLNAIRAQRAQFRLLVADEGQTVNGGVAPPTTTMITSNNSNSAYAKEGDTLTLIFTASEALRSVPAITIAGGTASVEAAGNIYTATYTVQTTDTNGPVTHNIGTLTDTAGNTADPPETTASITLDTTPPVISPTGNNPLTLEVGDTYTDPGATAEAGATVTVSPTTIPTDTAGSHTVTYTATDAAGNTATTTRTVSVQASGTPQPPADTTPPFLSSRVLTSSNTNAAYAKEGDTLTLIFEVSEALQSVPSVTIMGQTVTPTAEENTYTADYTVTASTPEGAVTHNIGTLRDTAGNTADPPLITASINIDITAPSITVSAITPAGAAQEKTVSATVTDTNKKSDGYRYAITAGNTCNNSIIADNNAAQAYTEGEDILLNQETYNTQYVCFRAEDEAGNIDYQVATEITGIDTTPPVISLTGTSPLTLEVGDTYTDPGATATEGVTVTTEGTVDTGTPGTYTITYTATDAAGNTATTTRTVSVQASGTPQPPADTTPPFLSSRVLTSSNTNAAYAKEGDTLTLIFTTSEALQSVPSVTIMGQTVTPTAEENTYTADYTVTASTPEGAVTHNIGTLRDTAGNTADPPLITASINIDITAPDITVGAITPAGAAQTKTVRATVIDTNKKSDGYRYAITAGNTCNNSIIADNNAGTAYTEGEDILLNQETYNTQVVCFRVEDEAGNIDYQVATEITGIDTTPPVISLTGTSPLTLEVGDTYTDPGATATEGVTVTTEGTVDTGTPGTYTITYTATDAAGNTATVERAVTVFVAGTLTIIVTNDEYTAPAPHKTVSATDTIADAADTVWHYIQIDSAAGDTACEADRFDGTETAYTEGADITLNSKDDNGDTICFKAVNEGNTYYKTSGVIGGIDQVAPTVTYTADKENFIKTGDTVHFTITLRDTGTIAAGTYLFTVSGAATGTCTVEVSVATQTATQTCAVTITGTTEGQMVTITASELRDVFGNTNTPTPQNMLRLDLSAPTIESLGIPDVSQKKKVTLSLSAIHSQHNSNAGIPETLRPVFGGDCADFETAVDWTDETPEDGQASAYEVTIPASGSYNNCTVKLVDAAGNESGQATFSEFTVKKGGGSAGRVGGSFKQITSFFSGGYEKQIPGVITGAPQGSVFIDLPAVYQSVELTVPEQVSPREIPSFAPTSGPEAPRGSVFIDLPAAYQSVELTVPEQVSPREIPSFAPTNEPETPRGSVFIDLPAAYQSVELTVPEQTPPTQQDVSPPQIPPATPPSVIPPETPPPATPPAEQPTVPVREQEPTPPQTPRGSVFIDLPAAYQSVELTVPEQTPPTQQDVSPPQIPPATPPSVIPPETPPPATPPAEQPPVPIREQEQTPSQTPRGSVFIDLPAAYQSVELTVPEQTPPTQQDVSPPQIPPATPPSVILPETPPPATPPAEQPTVPVREQEPTPPQTQEDVIFIQVPANYYR